MAEAPEITLEESVIQHVADAMGALEPGDYGRIACWDLAQAAIRAYLAHRSSQQEGA